MANTKISALTSGNPAQSGDLIPIDRSGSNFSLTASSIASLAGVVGPGNWQVPLPSFKADKVNQQIVGLTATTDNVIYTVPAGKRAWLYAIAANTTGGAIVITPKIRLSDGITKIAFPGISIANQAALGGGGGTVFWQDRVANTSLPGILEAGESFIANPAAGGLNIFWSALTLDASDTITIKSPKITTLTSGDNTIYTCPSGKVAFINNQSLGSSMQVIFTQSTGGAVVASVNIVQSGGTPSSSNLIANTLSVTSGTATTFTTTGGSPFLGPGDFVSINVNTNISSGQGWAGIRDIIEIPQ